MWGEERVCTGGKSRRKPVEGGLGQQEEKQAIVRLPSREEGPDTRRSWGQSAWLPDLRMRQFWMYPLTSHFL